MTPRHKSGSKLHYIGRAYVVLVDARDRETSARHEGGCWAAFDRPGHLEVVFLPDSTDSSGRLIIKALSESSAIALFVEDDDALAYRWPVLVGKEDTVDYHWAEALDVMA